MRVVVVIIIILLTLGLVGKVSTAGYKCHWVQVGDSQVCQ